MKTAILGLLIAAALPLAAAPPIRVMILDGEQAGAYHAWQETTPYLKKMLLDAGMFQGSGDAAGGVRTLGRGCARDVNGGAGYAGLLGRVGVDGDEEVGMTAVGRCRPGIQIDETIAAYEAILRKYDGNPPTELVVPLVRRHADEEAVVLARMLEAAERLGYKRTR